MTLTVADPDLVVGIQAELVQRRVKVVCPVMVIAGVEPSVQVVAARSQLTGVIAPDGLDDTVQVVSVSPIVSPVTLQSSAT